MDNTFNDLRNKVRIKIAELQLKAEELWGDKFEDGIAPESTVTFDLKGGRAGTAQYSRSGDHKLRFNRKILMENSEEFLNDTVPHEFAHLVTYALYGTDRDHKGRRKIKPHGDEWKRVMRLLGYKPSRCHNFKVEKARTVRRKYEYSCGCQVHKLTAVRHNKIKSGRSHYLCNRCGKKLERVRNTTLVAVGKREPYLVEL